MRKTIITLLTLLIAVSGNCAVYTTEFISSAHSLNKTAQVIIGGKKYDFAFDTGCSDLLINLNMLRELQTKGVIEASSNGQIKHSQMSNGRTHAVRELAIKHLQIGDYVFRNVVASVGINDEPDAEPLLGQSILARMKWYKIEVNTLSFEPQDEQLQQAMFYLSFYKDDESRNKEIISRTMPYIDVLPCSYLYQLLGQLNTANRYADAIDALHRLQQSGCSTTDDLTERELYSLYNWAVEEFNSQHYDESAVIVGKAEKIMETYVITDQNLSRSMYRLLYHLYSQTGNESKAKLYEKYK